MKRKRMRLTRKQNRRIKRAGAKTNKRNKSVRVMRGGYRI